MWSVIGYSLLALLGLLVLLLLVPVFVRVQYREELTVCVRVWGIPVYRFPNAKPRPPQTDKPKTTARKQPNTMLTDLSQRLKTDGVRAVAEEVQALARIAGGAARRVVRAITVRRLQLQLIVASCDAATTAQDTGRICAVLYPSLTAIQSVVRIRKREVTVTPDYLAEQGRVTAEVTGHVIPLRILWAALGAVVSYGALRSHNNGKEELQNGQ